MIPKGSTGRINRLINSAIVPKKAERYPLSTTERFVDATNDSRIGWTMIVAPIRPRLVRTTRIRKTVTKLKLIFYAFGCWKPLVPSQRDGCPLVGHSEQTLFVWKAMLPPLGYDGTLAARRVPRSGHSEVTMFIECPAGAPEQTKFVWVTERVTLNIFFTIKRYAFRGAAAARRNFRRKFQRFVALAVEAPKERTTASAFGRLVPNGCFLVGHSFAAYLSTFFRRPTTGKP